MVFEYCAHDMGRLLESMDRQFAEAEVKCLARQLLEAIEYLHSRWIVHRDLKLCNILLTREGCLKVCDFGLARYSQAYEEACTPNVVTLWYRMKLEEGNPDDACRAPEVLLGSEKYTDKSWVYGIMTYRQLAVGCVLAELLKHAPLFPGHSEVSMLNAFTQILGNPHKGIWPGIDELPHADKLALEAQPYNHLHQEIPSATPAALNLLNQLLTYDPEQRVSAARALQHPWFSQDPLPLKPEAMPTFPSTQNASFARFGLGLDMEASSIDANQVRQR